MTIKIIPNDTNNPPGKLADAEVHFARRDADLHALIVAVQQIVRETVTAVPTAAVQLHEAEARLLHARALAADALTLDGLKLIGFGIWERRTGGGRTVTFPARQYSVNGERRSFALLRPVTDATAQDRIRDLILAAYAEYETQQQDVDPQPGTHVGSVTGR